ncbi:MAG: Isoleucine-tRNA ligase [Microgenomates group bacterium GW2011_GWA1_46_15]|nr:MAG: Isoleucine-tRNA ligase [Microgenomates group bacterium GW2011_GWB1_45_17]KKU23294.1 MAG: Isoleucine-tRNA ligase [Microgenomates group bacterium GW2011_GWA1_46_15]
MKHIDSFQTQPNLPQLEEEVLKHWDETDAFAKSVSQRPATKPYIFYDGPPFATGLPHYGHLLASTIKDVIPRYWTMKGYRVERVWGWDCHGVPIENMIEKELDLKGGKKGIEEMGIGKFNAACRAAILRFDKDWEIIIKRLGRWVDFKHSYKTMDNTYMESVWWAFSQLHTGGLVYEGHKVILYCPRCATPLSNFEIVMDNSYKDVEDNSVYVKFKAVGIENEYFIAWTTTPWTLIGNVALAVDAKAEYAQVELNGELLWVAKKLVKTVFKGDKPVVKQTIKGKDLVGRQYEPLYTFMPLDGKKAHYIASADFVSLEDGTGIVHTAAIYGEDDYALAQKLNLPCVPTMDDQGRFLEFVTPLAGVFYKKAEDWIIEDLTKRALMYAAQKTTHSYPFCYRCSTPLYYNAVPAWFINVQKIKPELVKQNEKINWYPEFLKHGRFGKGLETAPDWNISRSRYWGTPMPVWVGEKTGKQRILSSFAELEKWAVKPDSVRTLTDYHREFLDDIEVWVDDAKTEKGRRIPDVFDCWVESGSMPYASIHYPFEHKDKFEASYPAQFISEYIAQTRAWFYTLHVMSVGLFGKPAFENAVTTGTILAADGSKMSKSKKNYPDPMLLIDKHGVDSTVMKADNVNFSEDGVNEIRKKVFGIWWNVFSFYKLYADQTKPLELPKKITHVMDVWIVSRITRLIQEVTAYMDAYDVVNTSRVLMTFVDELSTWYLRESRDRLRDKATNGEASQVFGWVLLTLAKLFAPITPFFPELLYQHLGQIKGESIHLEDWPVAEPTYIHDQLEQMMKLVREVVEKVHAARKEQHIKVRQPLARVIVTASAQPMDNVLDILKQEINVEEVVWTEKAESELTVTLDTTLTDNLKAKGEMREVMRVIQDLRKESNVGFDAYVNVQLPSWPKQFEDEIKKKTLVKNLTAGDVPKIV